MNAHAASRLALLTCLAAATSALLPSAAPAQSRPVTPVNAVIGDVSFLETFGRLPDTTTDDELRIETHLHYIEQALRRVDTSHLSPQQRARRQAHLDRLHRYHLKGGFPHSDGFPAPRRPNFQDARGRICAVGALMEPEALAHFEEHHKFDLVEDIDDPALAAWADHNGFTVDELAMIQPGYMPAQQSLVCKCVNTDLNLEPDRLEAYTNAVEGVLEGLANRLGECIGEGGPDPRREVILEIGFNGHPSFIWSPDPDVRGCIAAVLRTASFPGSCERYTRRMRFELHGATDRRPPAIEGLTYDVDPATQGAEFICDMGDDNNYVQWVDENIRKAQDVSEGFFEKREPSLHQSARTIRYDDQGRLVRYVEDCTHIPEECSDRDFRYSYDSVGRLTYEYHDGYVTRRRFDPRGLLVEEWWSRADYGLPLYRKTLQYDTTGRLVSTRESFARNFSHLAMAHFASDSATLDEWRRRALADEPEIPPHERRCTWRYATRDGRSFLQASCEETSSASMDSAAAPASSDAERPAQVTPPPRRAKAPGR